MRRVKSFVAVLAAVLCGVGIAQADPMDVKSAKKVLFKSSGMVVEPVELSGVTPKFAQWAADTVAQMGKRASVKALELQGYSYYGAIAVPLEGDMEAGLAIPSQLHSPQAAAAAALETCSDQIKGGKCILIAYLLPRKYKPRDLTLSQSATAGFEDKFGKGGPRYLAYSQSTNVYVIAAGAGADSVALQKCNEAAQGRNDCLIGVAEE